MRLFTVFAALVVFTACAPAPALTETTTAAAAASVFRPNTSAIFAGENARKLVNQCSRIAPGPVEGVWTPTDADIAALEPALGPYLDEQISQSRYASEARKAQNYYRQYGGLVIGGRRVIYVNGFDATSMPASSSVTGPPFDWHGQAIQICDGGPITFGVEYEPATRAFDNFAFNGSLG